MIGFALSQLTRYSRLFDWLVWRINQSTAGKGTGKKDIVSAFRCGIHRGNSVSAALVFLLWQESMKKIGILDIYGFEVFEWNSFEWLSSASSPRHGWILLLMV